MSSSFSYVRLLQRLSYLGIFIFVSTWSPITPVPMNQAAAFDKAPLLALSQQPGSTPNRPTQHIYDFTMDDIDGNPQSLSVFKGKVIMIVNTASFCGNTPQYAGLQTLYKRYREQGFTILAFPANDFGKQEPGNNKEIAEFCYTKYSLEFPLFSKITVLGDQTHPLYRYLTEDTAFTGEIKWNFQKFLVDRQGNVIARYQPKQKPLTEPIIHDIEKALGISSNLSAL
ncbi:MAG: glutathione peroxidase [Nitrospirota bacterium]|nr:glutathione peroxidase [Nitrospirota bacterium]